ncbi:MAG: sulfatase [Planctomycetota bacterium]
MHRIFLCVLSLTQILCNFSPTQAQVNVVQIVADDMGWTDLSTGATNLGNGSPYYETPNLDYLANGGVAFSSYYAQPSCSPTRAALLTGQYAPRNGLHTVGSLNDTGDETLLIGPDDGRAIKLDAVTIAELLQDAGYVTAHIGKFHATDDPDDIVNEYGFDFNIGGTTSGGPSGTVPYFAELNNRGRWVFGNAHGPELDQYADPYTTQYINDNLLPYANGNDPTVLEGTAKHLNDAMADAAVDFLNDRVADGQNFFVNIAFNAVHLEIHSRPDLETKYNAIPGSANPQHDNAAYAGLLEGMDQAIGRIVDAVEQSSLSGDTLIVFMSDNGGTNQTDNSPLRGSKGNHTDGGIRVPMIIYLPGAIQSGVSTDVAAHAVDLYPTYADLCGVAHPDEALHSLDGESLLPVLTGVSQELQRKSIFYHFPGYTMGNDPMSMTIHDGADGHRYKLFYFYEDRDFELYDLTSDITESTDLLAGDIPSLTTVQWEVASDASHELAEYLHESGAQFLTERATGDAVPAPHHTPDITIYVGADGLGAPLQGLQQGAVTNHGVTLNLMANGDSAMLGVIDVGIGVNSTFDSGSPNFRRRIDGTIGEDITFSFDTDVIIKELTIGSLNGPETETARLELVSGHNPFDGLIGYETDGVAVETNALLVTKLISNAAIPRTLRTGVLAQNEIFVPAGTELRILSDPAIDGGILLNSISVALPQSLQAETEQLQVTRGLLAGGGLGEIELSDDSDLVLQRNGADIQSRVEIEIQATSPNPYPAGISLEIESAVFARGNVTLTAELFDLDTGQWVEIYSQPASRFVDRTISATTFDRPERFVTPGSQTIIGRVRYQSDSARQNFSAGIDHMVWSVF